MRSERCSEENVITRWGFPPFLGLNIYEMDSMVYEDWFTPFFPPSLPSSWSETPSHHPLNFKHCRIVICLTSFPYCEQNDLHFHTGCFCSDLNDRLYVPLENTCPLISKRILSGSLFFVF